jgi:hypothetical protein
MGAKRRNTRKFPKRGWFTEVEMDGLPEGQEAASDNGNGNGHAPAVVAQRSVSSARLLRKK